MMAMTSRFSEVGLLLFTLLWLLSNTSAFVVNNSPKAIPRSRSGVVLHEIPPDATVQVTDVEEAIQILEEGDDMEDEIEIVFELPEPTETETFAAEQLAEEIETLILETDQPVAAQHGSEAVPAATADSTTTITTTQKKKNPLAGDIFRRYKFVKPNPNHTPQEAAVSASLYMNPATAKIASNLVISWEPEVAETLQRLARVGNPDRPFLCGLVGIPGSGKSTSAEILASLLGKDHEALVMPMDGFHMPLQQLAEFPNAADMIYRRGAPDTFDAEQLGRALGRIAYGDDESVTIPGFDHAVGDPVPDQHEFVRSKHKIVLCEGIYLLHDDDGWENIKRFFDWTIYIDANVDACIERLKERNKCIPGYTPEEIEARCDEVDRKNAELSRDGARKYASQIVRSGAS